VKYVADEDIYEYYLGHPISFKRHFLSPFREEIDPSLSFIRMSDGAVLWRDWGDSMQSKPESVVKFVMRCYNCSFQDALTHITEDLKGNYNSNITFVKRPARVYDKIRKEIQIKSRCFDDNDISFWNQYGISTKTLALFNVIPIMECFYNNYPMIRYDGIHPLYAYKFVENGNIYYKIYNPLTTDKSTKWRYNGTPEILQGYDQLPLFGDLLIITKSLKDVMVLYEIGYNSISLQSESTILHTRTFNLLRSRFVNIVIFYDNDTTGINRANIITNSFGIPSIVVPKEFNIKDISDYVANKNINEGKILMQELLTQIGIIT